MTQSTHTGAINTRQVYTFEALARVPLEQRQGHVVRIRMSRPTFSANLNSDGSYIVAFSDSETRSMGKVRFPPEGVQKLDLLHRRSAPGLTFYMSCEESGGYLAVGTDYREATRSYSW